MAHVTLSEFGQPADACDVDNVRRESEFILTPLVEQFEERNSHEEGGECVDGEQGRPRFKGFVVEEIRTDDFCLFGCHRGRLVQFRREGAGLTGAVAKPSAITNWREAITQIYTCSQGYAAFLRRP